MQGLRMRVTVAGAGAALVLATGASPGLAQDAPPRVLSARDTLRIDQVGSPALSPDGEWVAYTVRSRDMDDPDLEAVTHVWRVRVDGTGNRQLTRGPKSATVARVVARRRHHRVPRRPRRGRRTPGPRCTSCTPTAARRGRSPSTTSRWPSFEFAPDGSALLFTARDPLPEEEEKRREEEGDAEVVDALHRMTHLWLHDLETDETRRLTEGDFTVRNADWSPDSKQVAFETRPNPTANDGWQSDVWVLDVAGGRAPAPPRERRQRHVAALVAGRPHHRVLLQRDRLEQHPAQQALPRRRRRGADTCPPRGRRPAVHRPHLVGERTVRLPGPPERVRPPACSASASSRAP